MQQGRAVVGRDPANYVVVPLEIIPLDQPLPYALYVTIGSQAVLFRKAGDTLTAERANALRATNVSAVQVKESDWQGMLAALEASLEVSAHDGSGSEEGLALAARNLMMLYWREIELRQDLTSAYLERLRDLAAKLADAVVRDPKIMTKLLRRYGDPGLYFLSHTVNVAVFSIAIATKQRAGVRELRKIAAAALLHNVGNIFIPGDLFQVPRELTAEETRLVQSHVKLGSDLLAKRGATDDIIATALQHHESFDGTGYPNRLSKDEIHPYARICRIADTYDALLSARPQKADVDGPTETVRKMFEMKGQFDPAILSNTSFNSPNDDE